jgi:hypothetical protein
VQGGYVNVRYSTFREIDEIQGRTYSNQADYRLILNVSPGAWSMGGRSFKELQDELSRLMGEQIESLKKETFVSLSREEVRQQEERLQRIREVSADFLAALKRNEP